MTTLLAEFSSTDLAVVGTICAVAGAAITGFFNWLGKRNDTTAVLTKIAREAEKVDRDADAVVLARCIARIDALESLCEHQQDEISGLNKQLIELAKDHARILEENRYLKLEEQRTEKVRDEKHAAIQSASTLAYSVVWLKNVINLMDKDAGRQPRFANPASPDIEPATE